MRPQNPKMMDSTRAVSTAPSVPAHPRSTARTDRRQHRRLAAAALLLAAVSLACGGVEGGQSQEEDTSDTELGSNEQALGYPVNWEMPWPGGEVPYCYQPSPPITGHPQPGTTAFTQTIDMVEAHIAQYEAIPNADIDFQGGGLCPNWNTYVLGGDPDTVRIVITTADASTRFCDPNTSIAQGENVDDVCGGFDFEKEAVVVFGGDYGGLGILHELGHVLGFPHEYHRRSDGCNPNATTTVDGGITAYDFYSVMNATYCHWRSVLSELDNVGFAFMYPGTAADRLTVPASFRLPNEVILTAAQNTAAVEFTQRVAGVEGHHYSAAQWLKSTPSGSTQIATGASVSLGTVLSTSSEAIMRGSFTDFVGRVRTTPFTTVRRNPSQYAALVISATYL
jgi:hypothetical protein